MLGSSRTSVVIVSNLRKYISSFFPQENGETALPRNVPCAENLLSAVQALEAQIQVKEGSQGIHSAPRGNSCLFSCPPPSPRKQNRKQIWKIAKMNALQSWQQLHLTARTFSSTIREKFRSAFKTFFSISEI